MAMVFLSLTPFLPPAHRSLEKVVWELTKKTHSIQQSNIYLKHTSQVLCSHLPTGNVWNLLFHQENPTDVINNSRKVRKNYKQM